MSTAFDHTFDTLIDRTGTGSLKWDDMERIFGPVPQNAIPLWVADMDFHAPEAVQNAVKDVAAQGIYGYPAESSAPREAAATWLADRHGWAPGKESLVTVPGVVPGMALLIRELTAPGDGVAVQPPVYPPLFDCVRAAGRRVVENPLVETDGRWGMDLGGLEGIFKGGVRLLLLCSPHNPVGRVWTRDELSALADLCQRYGVMVVADEIHHDLVLPGHTHTVFASLPQCQPDRFGQQEFQPRGSAPRLCRRHRRGTTPANRPCRGRARPRTRRPLRDGRAGGGPQARRTVAGRLADVHRRQRRHVAG